jgi:hypothetical protein
MSTPRQVIFGTGAIGLAALEALRRRGETVRLVNRSGTAPVADHVEDLGGDASDSASTAAAAQGAQVGYQTLNPPRHPGRGLAPPQRPPDPDHPAAGRQHLPPGRSAPDQAPRHPSAAVASPRVLNPTVRELVELQYEFQEPFIVDSTKIAAKLNLHATPLDQALADTLASYRTKPS